MLIPLSQQATRCRVSPWDGLASPTFHGVSREQLQVYLDKFVFRHNRRGNPQAAFQTLLGLGTGRAPAPLSIVRGATDLPQFPIRP
jgi:hypothetical protein